LPTFEAEVIVGTLPHKNVRLRLAREALSIKPCRLRVFSIGDRTFLDTEEFAEVLDLVNAGQKSDYYDNFRQGATIVPRQLWFIEVVVSTRVGINPRMPTIKTSQRAIKLAKVQYRDVEMKGQVEGEFLFQTATGSELVPFGHLQLPLVVLPIQANVETAGRYRIVDSREAKLKGFSGLAEWLSKAEGVWKKKRGEKAEKLTIYQRLDYSRGITNQSSRTKLKVLYNTSGTYLVACVVINEQCEVTVNGTSVESNGLIADHKTYCWDTDDEDEAYYLVGLLNAPIIDRLIKPMQSRGDFGERDIHKKVLELPIPRYKPKNKAHKQVSELAKSCALKVKELLPPLAEKYDNIGKIRQVMKGELEDQVVQIDKLAKTILLSRGKAHRLDELLQSDS